MPVTDWPVEEGEDAALLHAVLQVFSQARSERSAPLRFGVAVSGGGDSVALLHLMSRCAAQAGGTLFAATVDHGLRAEAPAEAAQVAALCAGLGVPHQTLHWTGRQATGNLMDQARRARVRLIADWARSLAISDVALGHTADDQAESFLMNLSRAAGLAGLSGMRRAWDEDGVRWHRPLLAQSRADLRAYLRRNNIAWIDDPSNDNDRFARVKARRALAALKPLGITVARLNTTVHNLSMAQSALQWATEKAAEAITETAGALHLEWRDMRLLPEDIRRRLLIAMIRWINGAAYQPREAQLCQLERALDAGRDATLGGVRFRQRAGGVMVTRELRAVDGERAVGQLWDNRWIVSGSHGGQVRALGTEGLAQVKTWRAADIARDVLTVSPAVWHGDRLVSAPLLGFGTGYEVRLAPSFGLFLLSH